MKQYTNEHDQRTHDEILNKFHRGSDKLINSIIDKVAFQATEAYLDAAYGGRHDDGGSGAMQDKLKAFLDGINYELTGKTEVYSNMLDEIKKEQDSDWREYQRLLKKFGTVSNAKSIGINKV